MKVFLLVENYANKVRGVFEAPNARRKADAANAALHGVKATVVELNFVSPLEQKSLNETVKAVRR